MKDYYMRIDFEKLTTAIMNEYDSLSPIDYNQLQSKAKQKFDGIVEEVHP